MATLQGYSTKVPLSSSSEQAMRLAALRAVERTPNGPPEASARDLLVGILLAHPDRSEPQQLLAYAGAALSDLYNDLRQDGGFTPDQNPRGDWQGTPSVSESREVTEALAAADELAGQHNPEEPRFIRLRDLFGGLLITNNEASRLLEKVLTATAISLEDVKQSYPEFLQHPSSGIEYAAFLLERHPVTSYADYHADTAGDEDLVGIGPEVNAMAYLIAAKSLTPPLAIGLFGDWGSGKSFFIQALKRRIHKITKDVRDSREPQSKIDIYKYVVQIEFNAWQYVEGELWASLVEHVFRNLQLRTEESETELQRRKKHWIEELRKARQEEADIQELKAQLEAELEAQRKEIRKVEAQVEKKRRRLERLSASDVWAAIVLTPKEKAEIQKDLEAAGLGTVPESTTNLVAAVSESRELLQRGNALLTPLRASGWRGGAWVAAVLLVAFAGPALTLAVSQLIQLSWINEIFTNVGGLAAAMATYFAAANRWVHRSLASIESAQAKLDQKRKQAEAALVSEIARLRTEQSELVDRLAEVKREGERKREEIRELERELEGLTPGRVLLDFISERVGSEDYRKHLGVAALIRRDFERLSELIKESNKEFEQRDDGHPKAEDRHRINRIVLYVDDLDRCPPERVVEVLQAVHLLMAFPLFVVVVAVDARWLAQSLQNHYENLLRNAPYDLSGSAAEQATTHDYLEKIFQIPFWVKPLPERARVRIVQRLVGSSLVRREQAQDGGRPPGGTQGLTWDQREPERRLDPSVRTEFQPQGLKIFEEELAFMEELKALLGRSPRSVKRFVNVYRLIKASVMSREREFVSDRSDAPFKLVLFLLAAVTGLSAISPQFFSNLTRLAASSSTQAPTMEDLVKGLEERTTRNSQLGPLDSRASADLGRLKRWLEDDEREPWRKLELRSLAAWVPQVARFSYRIQID